MKISDIGKINWKRGNEWFFKWYVCELEFMGFKTKANQISKLFTNHSLVTISLNAQWFHEEKDYYHWDAARKKALQKGLPLLKKILSKTEKHINKIEENIENLKKVTKINYSVFKKFKKTFILLWHILDSDLGWSVGPFFENKFANKGFDQKSIDKLINDCFAFDKPLVFQKEAADLKKIYSKIPKEFKGKKITFKNLPQNIKNLLYKHTQDYRFLSGTTRLNEEPFTVKDFFNKMFEISHKNPGSSRKILPKKIVKRLNKQDLKFLSLIKRHIYYDNYTADLYDKLDYFMNNLLIKKFNLSFKELSWYSFTELEALVAKEMKLNKNQLNERKHYRVMAQINNEVAMFYGRDNFLKIQKLVMKKSVAKIQKIDTFTGMIAYRGLTKGKVKIVKIVKDINKVQAGDVLVSPMTHPDLMLAIKKCSGIITDTGGITCHAAIVSREYQIPCIVGTNIATQILKDGDLVELDANHGG